MLTLPQQQRNCFTAPNQFRTSLSLSLATQLQPGFRSLCTPLNSLVPTILYPATHVKLRRLYRNHVFRIQRTTDERRRGSHGCHHSFEG